MVCDVVVQLREEGATRWYKSKVQIDMGSTIYQIVVGSNSCLFLVDWNEVVIGTADRIGDGDATVGREGRAVKFTKTSLNNK